MDNKPLEQLAEDYIKTRLAKAKIKFLKPNYDTDGTDLVLLNPLNKHLAAPADSFGHPARSIRTV